MWKEQHDVFNAMALALIGVQVKNAFHALDKAIDNVLIAQEWVIVDALCVLEEAVLFVLHVQEAVWMIVFTVEERGRWIANSVLA